MHAQSTPHQHSSLREWTLQQRVLYLKKTLSHFDCSIQEKKIFVVPEDLTILGGALRFYETRQVQRQCNISFSILRLPKCYLSCSQIAKSGYQSSHWVQTDSAQLCSTKNHCMCPYTKITTAPYKMSAYIQKTLLLN